MSGTHNKDRANTKPGDLRAEMAKRWGPDWEVDG